MSEASESRKQLWTGLEQEQSRLLRHAMTRSGITCGDLWLRYFSIGGNVGEYEVDAYMQSLLSLPPVQRDLIAHAANELIDEMAPPPHAPYLKDLIPPRPAKGPPPNSSPGEQDREPDGG
ncbi:hypothetical protein [Pseudarthrobacter sp. DSP2-3-2b1]|uniref:hypothetical protein n=1 Tax=Pseudarthrobacter sp. DSP2-3-2b1 TaxID=2804661 RepID=UPI003CF401A9